MSSSMNTLPRSVRRSPEAEPIAPASRTFWGNFVSSTMRSSRRLPRAHRLRSPTACRPGTGMWAAASPSTARSRYGACSGSAWSMGGLFTASIIGTAPNFSARSALPRASGLKQDLADQLPVLHPLLRLPGFSQGEFRIDDRVEAALPVERQHPLKLLGAIGVGTQDLQPQQVQLPELERDP